MQVTELNDEDIPEENPELVAIDHEFLPDEPARVRIAIRYVSGCAARKAVLMGQKRDGPVNAFIHEAEVYTRRALRKRSFQAPYHGEYQELIQDFSMACIELLDREKALCAQPNCCIGTQVYNHLLWGVYRLAKRHYATDARTHDGSDTLEMLNLPASNPDMDQRLYEKESVERIARQYGPQALVWIRGRYVGNGYAQMQTILGIPESRSQLFESMMQRIVKTDK